MRTLRDFACLELSAQLEHIDWDNSIYVTSNFVSTVSSILSPGKPLRELGHFLRPVDVAIHFENSSSLLLLSEREADFILPLYWQKQLSNQHTRNAFLNFSFLKDFAGKELQRATEDEEMTGIPLQIRSCESEAPAYLRKDGLAR